ncbi:MAG: hypothetical protein CM1200mP25_0270 [Acidobacteriota bacterium]|nr:MAG: hypothetical protein CM1200mP25_0270 [Acidobacteriota bacterium]
MFDEEFVRNEDDDLNLRIAAQGGVTYVSPGLVSYKYWVRAQWNALFQQYLQYGYWKLKVVRKHRRPVSLRMFAPLLLVTTVGASMASWGLGSVVSARALAAPLVVYSVAMGIAVLSAGQVNHWEKTCSIGWRVCRDALWLWRWIWIRPCSMVPWIVRPCAPANDGF